MSSCTAPPLAPTGRLQQQLCRCWEAGRAGDGQMGRQGGIKVAATSLDLPLVPSLHLPPTSLHLQTHHCHQAAQEEDASPLIFHHVFFDGGRVWGRG